jgi:hypothetical protein
MFTIATNSMAAGAMERYTHTFASVKSSAVLQSDMASSRFNLP